MSIISVSAELVKKLREVTGGGMMKCKEALEACAGDLEKAKEWLRKHGIASAENKTGRAAGEGVIAATSMGEYGLALEINCETDFVMRSADFQTFVGDALETAKIAKPDSLADLKVLSPMGKSATLEEEGFATMARLGENIVLRRFAWLSVHPGVVVSYVHGQTGPSMGKIGVLVALESSIAPEHLQDIGKKIAMHIAALQPKYLSADQVPASILETERRILKEQALQGGSPEDRVDQIVEGRLKKFLEDYVLEEQKFVHDSSKKVKAILEETSKTLGGSLKIAGFICLTRGEELVDPLV